VFYSLITKTKTSNDFFITTNNGVIDETDIAKYLGVMIDGKLTWENQIHHVVKKKTMYC